MMGTPAARIAVRASVFEPISSIADAGGPIHVIPAVLDGARKRRILGQEAVPGVDRGDAGPERGLDDHIAAQVALVGRPRPDPECLVRDARVERATVGVGVDGDRLDVRARGAS